MTFDFKNVLNPTGQVDNHIIREMFDDLKTEVNTFATVSLDNLTSVAINTSLVPDTDDTYHLGSINIAWHDVFMKGSLKYDGSTAGLTVGSIGDITQPNQPSFLVTISGGASNVTGDGTLYTVVWTEEIFDLNGDFSSTTFTAPVAGKYQFTGVVTADVTSTAHQTRVLRLDTSNRIYGARVTKTLGTTNETFTVSVLADMDTNDTAILKLFVDSSAKTVGIMASEPYTHFSGSLIN